MSEHQFKSIYRIGYGDALCECRRKAKPMVSGLVIVVAVLAFWAGRATMRAKVTEAYEAGFEAGVREGTTNWGEWK